MEGVKGLSWPGTRMLKQLTDGVRCRFPVFFTHKFACDMAVVTLLRARIAGNTPTTMRNNLHELHSEEWLKKELAYLTECKQHQRGLSSLLHSTPQTYEQPYPFPSFPTPKWFLAVYVRDVWSWKQTLLAEATSVNGCILKVDSTKKVTKELQGAAAGSAMWMTNVGNEHGQILASVLTSSENITVLQPLATQHYISIHTHLLKSEQLLEGTHLEFFMINETTLIKWYKNTVRRDEVRMLMQRMPRQKLSVATTPLPSAASLPPTQPPPPLDAIVFEEPEDTTGQAHTCRRPQPGS